MPHFERKRVEIKQSEPAIDIKSAYERARKINDQESIDPQKFEHYDKTMVLRDMELVQRREADFRMQSTRESEENKKVATILEAILHEQIGTSDWIGPNVSTIKSSRFDDIVNGVDSIARIQREGEGDTHLGLAIDVTFSSHITDKLDRIKDDVKNGKLTQIKYFASPNPEDAKEYTYMGSLKVPRVVIGIEKKAVLDLAKALNYEPNHLAQSLRSRRTHTIGVVVPEIFRNNRSSQKSPDHNQDICADRHIDSGEQDSPKDNPMGVVRML